MIIDRLLLFTGGLSGATSTIAVSATSTNDAPTTGTQVSSNVVDLGVTDGVPSSANGGGARDIGIGDDPSLKLYVMVTTTFTGGTNLTTSLEGAPDNGSGAAGSYTAMWTSPAILEASLVQGAYIANVDVPRTVPGQALPRFLRLSFVTSGTHTAGAVIGGILLDRFDQVGLSGTLSGYPAGVTVAN
jgi:hypothetical protein